MRKKLLELDARQSSRMNLSTRPGWLRRLAVVFAHSGDSWFWLVGLVILWLVGTDFWKNRALALGIAIVVTAVIVLAIKFTVRRQRPEGEWGAVYRTTDPHSFPSGHAARAFMLAVMGAGLGPAWFAGLLLAWAPLVTLARVAMGVHYLSDVLAGALFGLAIGALLLTILPF